MKIKSISDQKDLEETMKKIASEIECIEDKIKVLDIKEKESLEEIKMCSYYKRGFCKLESNCSFFHPEKKGWCPKSKC